MLKVKCIGKIRDKNNHIIGYTILGENKKTISVKSDALKRAIRSGQVDVINLTLTSDNRLIDKKPDTPSKHTTTHSKPSAEAVFNRAKVLGYNIETFDTDCGHECYIASSPDNTKHLLIIPDDVKYIYDKNITCEDIPDKDIYIHMSNIRGTLKVIGGKNLISTHYMFYMCNVQSIDLSSLDTSKLTNMVEMFYCCRAQSIDLSSLDTSKVTNMSEMFMDCEAQSLDLSSFNTSKVTDMSHMFRDCAAQFIDLSSFDTSNVTDMQAMFGGCRLHSIDLSSFNTSNVTDMCMMFEGCNVHSIDLSSFDTRNVKDMQWMFQGCKAQSIDLSSFDTRNVTDMSCMFESCKAQIKASDPKLKAQLQSDRR